MGINKVILVGNVGNDPEIKYVREDLPVARFSLATSESYRDKNGQKVTTTEWHNITIWRGLAKIVEQYVKKGAQLYIEGKITTRSYEKDGQTKYITEILADKMQMLGKPVGETSSPVQPEPSRQKTEEIHMPETETIPVDLTHDDDLPF